jgi:hypothetical protein
MLTAKQLLIITSNRWTHNIKQVDATMADVKLAQHIRSDAAIPAATPTWCWSAKSGAFYGDQRHINFGGGQHVR